MEPQTEVREPGSNGHGTGVHGTGVESQRLLDQPVVRLLRDLVQESQALFRAESQLMRSEMAEKTAQLERGIASMVSGAAVLFAGMVVLLSAIAIALSSAMKPWVAFLVVGIAATLIGAGLAAMGKKKIEVKSLKPQRAIDEAKADGRLVRDVLS